MSLVFRWVRSMYSDGIETDEKTSSKATAHPSEKGSLFAETTHSHMRRIRPVFKL